MYYAFDPYDYPKYKNSLVAFRFFIKGEHISYYNGYSYNVIGESLDLKAYFDLLGRTLLKENHVLDYKGSVVLHVYFKHQDKLYFGTSRHSKQQIGSARYLMENVGMPRLKDCGEITINEVIDSVTSKFISNAHSFLFYRESYRAVRDFVLTYSEKSRFFSSYKISLPYEVTRFISAYLLEYNELWVIMSCALVCKKWYECFANCFSNIKSFNKTLVNFVSDSWSVPIKLFKDPRFSKHFKLNVPLRKGPHWNDVICKAYDWHQFFLRAEIIGYPDKKNMQSISYVDPLTRDYAPEYPNTLTNTELLQLLLNYNDNNYWYAKLICYFLKDNDDIYNAYFMLSLISKDFNRFLKQSPCVYNLMSRQENYHSDRLKIFDTFLCRYLLHSSPDMTSHDKLETIKCETIGMFKNLSATKIWQRFLKTVKPDKLLVTLAKKSGYFKDPVHYYISYIESHIDFIEITTLLLKSFNSNPPIPARIAAEKTLNSVKDSLRSLLAMALSKRDLFLLLSEYVDFLSKHDDVAEPKPQGNQAQAVIPYKVCKSDTENAKQVESSDIVKTVKSQQYSIIIPFVEENPLLLTFIKKPDDYIAQPVSDGIQYIWGFTIKRLTERKKIIAEPEPLLQRNETEINSLLEEDIAEPSQQGTQIQTDQSSQSNESENRNVDQDASCYIILFLRQLLKKYADLFFAYTGKRLYKI